jgi:hypothetical protein
LDIFIVFKSRNYKKTQKNTVLRANVTNRSNIALSRLPDSKNTAFKTLCSLWLMRGKIWSPLSLGKHLHRNRKSSVIYYIPHFHIALFSLGFHFHYKIFHFTAQFEVNQLSLLQFHRFRYHQRGTNILYNAHISDYIHTYVSDFFMSIVDSASFQFL